MDAKEKKKMKKNFSLKAIQEGSSAPCKPAVYTDLPQTKASSHGKTVHCSVKALSMKVTFPERSMPELGASVVR